MTARSVEAGKNMFLPLLTRRAVVMAFGLAVVALLLPFDGWRWPVLATQIIFWAVYLVDVFLTSSPAKVGVQREFPDTQAMNSPGELVWIISNGTRRRITVQIADEIAPSMRAAKRELTVGVPAMSQVNAGTTFNPSRRGRHVVNELVVRTYGPLGLAARQGRRRSPAVLRVYPPFESRRQAELRIEKARIAEVGLRSVRSRGGGTEFEQLREYTIDDDPRRIDWSATARLNKPIVRTYRAEQNQNVMILMDCGRVMAGLVGGVTRLEHGIDAAMAMATVTTRLGDRVGLVAFDQLVRAEMGLGQGPAQVTRMTEALYGLQPQLVESDYRTAFVRMMLRARRRSMVILVTEHATGATDESLLPALPMVARDHLVVVAGVRDPDVSMWARSSPAETANAHRKAAAVASLSEREKTLARLRASGATVVDAEPGKLAGILADTYLEVKASGRL